MRGSAGASGRVVQPQRRAALRHRHPVAASRAASLEVTGAGAAEAGAVEAAGPAQQRTKGRGQRAEAPGELFGIHATSKRSLRTPRLRWPEHKPPRRTLCPPQEEEHEKAHGNAPAAGALGEHRQRDQHRHDATKRLVVPRCKFHVRPSVFAEDIVARNFWGVDGIRVEIVEGVDFVGDGAGVYPRGTVFGGLQSSPVRS